VYTRKAGGEESLTGPSGRCRCCWPGLTSGAVARRLFISPGIVNARLRRMFARPGVPGRVALAAVVHHWIG
jgi:hypothetical protein